MCPKLQAEDDIACNSGQVPEVSASERLS
jgi:hypothetical protein